jgi:hypothetical protein
LTTDVGSSESHGVVRFKQNPVGVGVVVMVDDAVAVVVTKVVGIVVAAVVLVKVDVDKVVRFAHSSHGPHLACPGCNMPGSVRHTPLPPSWPSYCVRFSRSFVMLSTKHNPLQLVQASTSKLSGVVKLQTNLSQKLLFPNWEQKKPSGVIQSDDCVELHGVSIIKQAGAGVVVGALVVADVVVVGLVLAVVVVGVVVCNVVVVCRIQGHCVPKQGPRNDVPLTNCV